MQWRDYAIGLSYNREGLLPTKLPCLVVVLIKQVYHHHNAMSRTGQVELSSLSLEFPKGNSVLCYSILELSSVVLMF